MRSVQKGMAGRSYAGLVLQGLGGGQYRKDERMLHCSGCSASLQEGDHTCHACGMPVNGTSAPTLIENRGLRAVPAATPAEDEPSFSPGELLVDRYRVVAFLGR